MERFDPEVNAAISHVMLLKQAVGSGAVPQAYLCCAVCQQQIRIFCLHLHSKYTSALDGQTTLWDGVSFAFLGDLVHGMVTTVMLPGNAFRVVGNIWAKTADYMVTNLVMIAENGFEPVPQDEADATIVSTRRLMYLPARYVALMLDPAGYTLKQAWEVLCPTMINHNDLQACAPSLK